MEVDTSKFEELKLFDRNADNPDILDRFTELCTTYRMDAGQVVVEWLAYAQNKKCTLNMANLNAMERAWQSKKAKAIVKTPKAKSGKSNVIYDINTLQDAVGGGDDLLEAYGTPNTKSTTAKRQHTPDHPTNKRLVGVASGSLEAPFSPTSFSPSSGTPSQKYSSRTNAGQVVCNYGNGTKVTWKTQKGMPSSIMPYDSNMFLSKKFKYMFVKLADKAAVLNDLLEELGVKLQKQNNIEEFSHVSLPQQEQLSVVGRICCDSVGKLNAKSVVLEGSRQTSAGRRIPVDLTSVKQYSLFPGQVVAMDGINSTGAKFVATKMHNDVLPAAAESSGIEEALRVVVACGPYTTSDSTLCEPLADLVQTLQKSPPDVCILLGPFVDTKNQGIQKGDMNLTYDEMFRKAMVELARNTQSLPTQLVIVPSARDIHHDPVYPQPPFANPFPSEYKHVHFVSDPSTLTIDGVVFGITSTDILFHLGSEEIACPPGSSDRLGRLTRHLLTQQNYYPLYPPHDEMNVDYDHFEVYAQMPVKPHVLIIPSDLRYFVKDIDGCVCLNPGRLTKGHVGGTYARLMVSKPGNPSQAISESIVAEVLRI